MTGNFAAPPDGYVSVEHVELDIKEMLELGKRANVHKNTSSNAETDGAGNRCLSAGVKGPTLVSLL